MGSKGTFLLRISVLSGGAIVSKRPGHFHWCRVWPWKSHMATFKPERNSHG